MIWLLISEVFIEGKYFARKVWYNSGQLVIDLDDKEYNQTRALSLRGNGKNLSLIASGDAPLIFMVSHIPKNRNM
jgi:hypothetical protein